MSLRGNTRDFPLDVLLQLLADTKKTGELALHSSAGEGALGIDAGRVVTAVYGNEPPVPALGAVFDLAEADFEFTPWDSPPPANLEGDLDELLRRAEEHKQWLTSVREVVPNDRVRFRLSERAADQGAVTFTADRWRAVLAVDGQRDVNGIAQHMSIDTYAALDLLAGLVRDGVIETIEPPAEVESSWADVAPETTSEPAPAEPEPAAEETSAAPEPAREDDRSFSSWGTAEATPSETVEEATPEASAEPVAYEPAPPEPPAPEAPAPEPAAQDWGAPAPADQWAPAAPPEPEQPAAMDDRLAALFGTPPAAPSEPPPAPDQWSAPAHDQWAPPQQEWAPAQPETAEPAQPAYEDPRLAAMSAPSEAPAEPETGSAREQGAEPELPLAPANEWAPPPATEAPSKRSGLFGMFRREEPAPEPATRTTLVDRSASSRAGQLAAFSNALLTEYNSGHYGKNRVDDRIPSLLMRVDEQADPIDRPLPVVDDRLDVQALERTKLPETQSVPYLATLVATIYGDAEKAFGRDKAKRGYKAAQQHVFGGDLSALAEPDVAGKLPKI